MKLRKVDLVKAIESFRSAKLKELVTLKSDIARHKTTKQKWEKDRSKFVVAHIPADCKVSMSERWNSHDWEVSLTYHIDPKQIPAELKNEPSSPKSIDSLQREIKAAEDQLALIKMCPEDVITINSKIDRDAIQPYIEQVNAY